MTTKPAKLQRWPDWLRSPYTQPTCFLRGEWELWRKAAMDGSLKSHPPKSHCEDCTPEHQAAMVAAQRCEHPGVTFRTDAHGFLSGVRPEAKATQATTTPQPKRGRPKHDR